MKVLSNFIAKNSQRLFYLTGGGLLFAIALFVLMQFVSWDEDFLRSQFSKDSGGKLQDAFLQADTISLENKLSADTVPILVIASKKKDEVVIDQATRKDLQEFVAQFLNAWENFPRDDYKESLAPYVLSESLSKVAKREDSLDNPLLNCSQRCLYSSFFPPQEIPLKILSVNDDYIEISFSAFVSYKSLDGKRGDLSGLQPRFYSLIIVPGENGWLVARALADDR